MREEQTELKSCAHNYVLPFVCYEQKDHCKWGSTVAFESTQRENISPGALFFILIEKPNPT